MNKYASSILVSMLSAIALSVATGAELRIRLENSISRSSVGSAMPLQSGDLKQEREFMVALKMRDLSGLQSRIAKGEIITPAELAATYYPLETDYQAISEWLTSQGFTITKTDPSRLGIFVSGTIGQICEAFGTEFGRVTSDNRTYVSAITAPIVPQSVSTLIVGLNGLQPHLKLRRHSHRVTEGLHPEIANAPPFLVSEILKAYSANGLSVNGSGEKIAIIIDTFPKDSDLTSFWTVNGINQSLNNIEEINVPGGSLPGPSGEETLDTEWTSGIASGAMIRIYAAGSVDFASVDQAFAALIADLPSQPELHELSISLGLGEKDVAASQITTDSQYLSSIAAQGVSIFVSSGDSGSLENNRVQASYFASDPSVTGVGGTNLSLSACTGLTTNESVWNDSFGASGGGISSVFSRPSWQVGTGVPAGSFRLVPDVAAAADVASGALVVLNGSEEQFGGTSWSAPLWAGFAALLNQARANASLAPVGFLNSHIYKLVGTAAFRDITTGNNITYSATAGYDLCTGLGSPNVTTLLNFLTTDESVLPPSVPGQPQYGQILDPDGSLGANCPLTASNVTFRWSAGNANAYILWIGNKSGGSDILNSGQTGSYFMNVSHLPTDGRQIYAKLWSRIGSSWTSAPVYTYTTLAGAVLAPVINPASGSYSKKVVVSMASGTSGAQIYYTTDGTTPNKFSSMLYAGSLTFKKTTVIKAIATKTGVPDSSVATAQFKIR